MRKAPESHFDEPARFDYEPSATISWQQKDRLVRHSCRPACWLRIGWL
ncbi:MAG: hypothetical protein OXN19_15965 [Caldilineaceae bacterium]|nr:hypothetical protein [Caldilineaceae bacterium]